MTRLFIYIALAIIVAFIAVWFVDQPGHLILTWGGWEIRMSVAVLSCLFVIYTIACWFIFKLYRWFKTDNPLASPLRKDSRRNKGIIALDQAWSALAIHDYPGALRHGKKARSLLPGESGPLRLLIKAGSPEEQETCLHQLSENPHTRITALTAQLDQKIHQKNFQAAYDILQELHGLAPANMWVRRKIFDMLTRLGKWDAAHGELKALIKGKAIDANEGKHLTAVLFYAQAVEADLASQKTTARDHAQAALKSDPSLIPAALLLSRHHLAHNDKAKARKTLETIWKNAPHPDLADVFLDLEPMESPSEKYRRVEKFCDLNKDHRHSLHFLAKISLMTEHWAEGKKALNLIQSRGAASQETFHLLARLELLQKQDKQAADHYMAQTKQAPADPAWKCLKCETTLGKFAAKCPHCHEFGKVIWQGS